MTAPFVQRIIRSLWTPPESVFQHLHFSGVFSVEVEPGASFSIEAGHLPVENDLFWRGYGKGWESETLKLWAKLSKSSNCIIDIGANSGVYALAAAALNPSADIVALEPSPQVFSKLQRNIALNGFSIEALEIAATDVTGSVTFHDFECDHQYSASIETDFNGTRQIEVKATTIDDLVARESLEPNLIKLDIERHEPAALAGGRETIKSFRPIIICEILDVEREQAVHNAMDGLHYHFERICPYNVLLTP